MKKIILLFFTILLLCSCKKEEYEIKNIDELISYNVINYFEKDTSQDEGEKTNISQSYYSTKDDAFFQVQIFSYKNKDMYNLNAEYTIDENDYISSLSHQIEMIVDNEEFYIGYIPQDDIEDVIAKAYVRHKDYVFEFTMSNFDSQITNEQYEDFLKIIQSVKFKY